MFDVVVNVSWYSTMRNVVAGALWYCTCPTQFADVVAISYMSNIVVAVHLSVRPFICLYVTMRITIHSPVIMW